MSQCVPCRKILLLNHCHVLQAKTGLFLEGFFSWGVLNVSSVAEFKQSNDTQSDTIDGAKY